MSANLCNMQGCPNERLSMQNTKFLYCSQHCVNNINSTSNIPDVIKKRDLDDKNMSNSKRVKHNSLPTSYQHSADDYIQAALHNTNHRFIPTYESSPSYMPVPMPTCELLPYTPTAMPTYEHKMINQPLFPQEKTIDALFVFDTKEVVKSGMTVYEYIEKYSTNRHVVQVLTAYMNNHIENYKEYVPTIYADILRIGELLYTKRRKVCIITVYMDTITKYGYQILTSVLPTNGVGFIDYSENEITLHFIDNNSEVYRDQCESIVYVDKHADIHDRKIYSSRFGSLYYIFKEKTKKILFNM